MHRRLEGVPPPALPPGIAVAAPPRAPARSHSSPPNGSPNGNNASGARLHAAPWHGRKATLSHPALLQQASSIYSTGIVKPPAAAPSPSPSPVPLHNGSSDCRDTALSPAQILRQSTLRRQQAQDPHKPASPAPRSPPKRPAAWIRRLSANPLSWRLPTALQHLHDALAAVESDVVLQRHHPHVVALAGRLCEPGVCAALAPLAGLAQAGYSALWRVHNMDSTRSTASSPDPYRARSGGGRRASLAEAEHFVVAARLETFEHDRRHFYQHELAPRWRVALGVLAPLTRSTPPQSRQSASDQTEPEHEQTEAKAPEQERTDMTAELLLAHLEQHLFSLFKHAVLAQTPADKLAECADSDGVINTVLKAAARVSDTTMAATTSNTITAGADMETPPKLQQLGTNVVTLCPAAVLLPSMTTQPRPHAADSATHTTVDSARDARDARTDAPTSAVGAAVDAHLWSVLLYYALRVTPRAPHQLGRGSWLDLCRRCGLSVSDAASARRAFTSAGASAESNLSTLYDLTLRAQPSSLAAAKKTREHGSGVSSSSRGALTFGGFKLSLYALACAAMPMERAGTAFARLLAERVLPRSPCRHYPPSPLPIVRELVAARLGHRDLAQAGEMNTSDSRHEADDGNLASASAQPKLTAAERRAMASPYFSAARSVEDRAPAVPASPSTPPTVAGSSSNRTDSVTDTLAGLEKMCRPALLPIFEVFAGTRRTPTARRSVAATRNTTMARPSSGDPASTSVIVPQVQHTRAACENASLAPSVSADVAMSLDDFISFSSAFGIAADGAGAGECAGARARGDNCGTPSGFSLGLRALAGAFVDALHFDQLGAQLGAVLSTAAAGTRVDMNAGVSRFVDVVPELSADGASLRPLSFDGFWCCLVRCAACAMVESEEVSERAQSDDADGKTTGGASPTAHLLLPLHVAKLIAALAAAAPTALAIAVQHTVPTPKSGRARARSSLPPPGVIERAAAHLLRIVRGGAVALVRLAARESAVETKMENKLVDAARTCQSIQMDEKDTEHEPVDAEGDVFTADDILDLVSSQSPAKANTNAPCGVPSPSPGASYTGAEDELIEAVRRLGVGDPEMGQRYVAALKATGATTDTNLLEQSQPQASQPYTQSHIPCVQVTGLAVGEPQFQCCGVYYPVPSVGTSRHAADVKPRPTLRNVKRVGGRPLYELIGGDYYLYYLISHTAWVISSTPGFRSVLIASMPDQAMLPTEVPPASWQVLLSAAQAARKRAALSPSSTRFVSPTAVSRWQTMAALKVEAAPAGLQGPIQRRLPPCILGTINAGADTEDTTASTHSARGKADNSASGGSPSQQLCAQRAQRESSLEAYRSLSRSRSTTYAETSRGTNAATSSKLLRSSPDTKIHSSMRDDSAKKESPAEARRRREGNMQVGQMLRDQFGTAQLLAASRQHADRQRERHTQERATRVRERARSVGQMRAAELEAMLEVEQVQLEAQAEHAALEDAQESAKEAAQGTQAPISTDGLDVTSPVPEQSKAASNFTAATSPSALAPPLSTVSHGERARHRRSLFGRGRAMHNIAPLSADDIVAFDARVAEATANSAAESTPSSARENQTVAAVVHGMPPPMPSQLQSEYPTSLHAQSASLESAHTDTSASVPASLRQAHTVSYRRASAVSWELAATNAQDPLTPGVTNDENAPVSRKRAATAPAPAKIVPRQLDGSNAEHVLARAPISVPQQQPELSPHVQRQSTVEPQERPRRQSRRVADAKLEPHEALESNTTESEACDSIVVAAEPSPQQMDVKTNTAAASQVEAGKAGMNSHGKALHGDGYSELERLVNSMADDDNASGAVAEHESAFDGDINNMRYDTTDASAQYEDVMQQLTRSPQHAERRAQNNESAERTVEHTQDQTLANTDVDAKEIYQAQLDIARLEAQVAESEAQLRSNTRQAGQRKPQQQQAEWV